jgi:methylmalonyl-CoA/ethylmalonyl-CoA epimerase
MNNHKGTKSPFSKLVQVGVVVKDMDKTIAQLTSLGIGPFETRAIPPDAEEWFGDKRMDATFRICGAMVGGIDLELIQPLQGESPHQEFLDKKGEGIQHLAFSVDDVDSEVEALTKKGAKVQMRADLSIMKVAYVDLNTSGLVFELMQQK